MSKHKSENVNDIPAEAPQAASATDANQPAPPEWESQGEVREHQAVDETITVNPEELLKAEVAELKDKMLRKEADFQNYRRRMAKEVGDARRLGLYETVTPFLQLFDLFGMAMKAADTSDNIAALKQGLAMILAEYGKALDELGVQKFDAVGIKFDPAWHDAVSYEVSASVPEGVVIKQWNCGYKIGDRLLRPARVVVSSGPEKAADEPVSASEK